MSVVVLGQMVLQMLAAIPLKVLQFLHIPSGKAMGIYHRSLQNHDTHAKLGNCLGECSCWSPAFSNQFIAATVSLPFCAGNSRVFCDYSCAGFTIHPQNSATQHKCRDACVTDITFQVILKAGALTVLDMFDLQGRTCKNRMWNVQMFLKISEGGAIQKQNKFAGGSDL